MPQTVEQYLSQFPPVGTISARTPTARERQTTGFQNMLFSDDREGAAKANRLMNVLDYTGANVPAMGYDLGQSAAQGDIGSLALTAGIGMLPAVGRKLKSNNIKSFLSDMSGMFMGPKAKNADLPALSAAQLLKEQGAPREEILSKTGWFQQKDGKWAFETSDKSSSFRMPTVGQSDLATALKHPDLYSNYPSAAKVRLQLSDEPGFAAAYSPDAKNLQLNYRNTDQSARSPILHEVSHAVSDIEGFAPGSNPDPRQALVQGTPANQIYTKMVAERPPRSVAEGLSMQRMAAEEGYHTSLGEVNARNVQRRRDFDSAQLRSTPPWTTQDVPEAQVLMEQPQLSGLSGLLNRLRGR